MQQHPRQAFVSNADDYYNAMDSSNFGGHSWSINLAGTMLLAKYDIAFTLAEAKFGFLLRKNDSRIRLIDHALMRFFDRGLLQHLKAQVNVTIVNCFRRARVSDW